MIPPPEVGRGRGDQGGDRQNPRGAEAAGDGQEAELRHGRARSEAREGAQQVFPAKSFVALPGSIDVSLRLFCIYVTFSLSHKTKIHLFFQLTFSH